MTKGPKKIQVGTDTFEFDVNESDSIIIQRYFTKYTNRDLDIQNQPVPNNPLWLKYVITLIRLYQKNISQKIGNRCVFDPSCSHYSEMAFRKNGFIKGIVLTVKRLRKCKAANGGVDELL